MIPVTFSTKFSTRFLELVSPAPIGLWNSCDYLERDTDLLSGRCSVIDHAEVFVETDES